MGGTRCLTVLLISAVATTSIASSSPRPTTVNDIELEAVVEAGGPVVTLPSGCSPATTAYRPSKKSENEELTTTNDGTALSKAAPLTQFTPDLAGDYVFTW